MGWEGEERAETAPAELEARAATTGRRFRWRDWGPPRWAEVDGRVSERTEGGDGADEPAPAVSRRMLPRSDPYAGGGARVPIIGVVTCGATSPTLALV